MKPKHLNIGDKVAIVSLSSGALGENFAKHELELGVKRLEELELEPVIMPNATKGIKYLAEHPEARVADLEEALLDKKIKGIICAIGGTDAFKTIPHIMQNAAIKEAIKNNPKIFMGFSDSTINHLSLNKLGLNTFYGPAFLTDFAELDNDMLPYTKYCFLNMFLNRKNIELASSEVWYDERTDFSPSAMGTSRDLHLEENGYITLCGSGKASGKLFGGCIDSIYGIYSASGEAKKVYDKFNILPESNSGKIVFLETSDNKPEPKEFEKMLKTLKDNKFFDGVAGVIFGKPQNQAYFEEYQKIIKNQLSEYPVLYNVNFGHSYPRCIIPYNIKTEVDFDKRKITFKEEWFE